MQGLRKHIVVWVLAELSASVLHSRSLVPLSDIAVFFSPLECSLGCVDAFGWNGLTGVKGIVAKVSNYFPAPPSPFKKFIGNSIPKSLHDKTALCNTRIPL